MKDTATEPFVDPSIPSIDEAAPLSGRGFLVDLQHSEGALAPDFRRLPHGHAEIRAINIGAAAAALRVVAGNFGTDVAQRTPFSGSRCEGGLTRAARGQSTGSAMSANRG
ncbi:hypothetical protein [Maritimibacter sp. DP1N21-5]|uniref:hypothetical protein n=1 Tax=Maritimibacter sp. DP1N21-5 TaxID=2836867 RepID=UPI001C45D9EB|nr:hypothetical protein [Maritimibacter sp. DP1N21-5]MBV7410605.1 hypothetical protein [Maritimibacter sp. DP1N21-5]